MPYPVSSSASSFPGRIDRSAAKHVSERAKAAKPYTRTAVAASAPELRRASGSADRMYRSNAEIQRWLSSNQAFIEQDNEQPPLGLSREEMENRANAQMEQNRILASIEVNLTRALVATQATRF
jgi:hypothetical protein